MCVVDCVVVEILQVGIQNSGSFGIKLGSLEAPYLSVPNSRFFQMITLFFLDLNNKTTLAIFRDSHHQERTLNEDYSKSCSVQTQLCPEFASVENHDECLNFKRVLFKDAPFLRWGTRWRIWLSHCTTSRKVGGSIFDGVIGIFH